MVILNFVISSQTSILYVRKYVPVTSTIYSALQSKGFLCFWVLVKEMMTQHLQLVESAIYILIALFTALSEYYARVTLLVL